MRSTSGKSGNHGRHRTVVYRALAAVLAVVLALFSLPGIARAEEENAYYFGTVTEHSTFNQESDVLNDSFYFSDSWFKEDPAVRNDALALVSMQLTAAAIDGSADGSGKLMLEQMGFTDIAFADPAGTDANALNYTHGKKTLADGRTLVAVVIQSFAMDASVKEQGWRQNFIVNSDEVTSGEHFGFARASDIVFKDIEALGSDDAVFWIMGQSRGGALADLIAKRLGSDGRTVYGYTFESPATVDAEAVTGSFDYIHNYLCCDDIVTKIPMWGMTRYGSDVELKTEETDAAIREELEKLGSEAASESVPDAEGSEQNILDGLSARVGSRADYSKKRTDEFTDDKTGEAVSLSYSYQDTLSSLMGLVFGGSLSGAAAGLIERLGELAPAVFALVEAVKNDGTPEALPYYYQAATELHQFLDSLTEDPLDFSLEDTYALLVLAGPLLVNIDHEPIGDPTTDMIIYLSPVLEVASNVGGFTYSHQFDTEIARLKTLAPAPEMEDTDITVDDPAAGDAADKAPLEVKTFFEGDDFKDAGGALWASAEAVWKTEDTVLQQDSLYYLELTLPVIGHTVPEGLQLTVNGVAPVEGPTVTYKGGAAVIHVTYAFEIGEVPEVKVSFDTGDKAETPAPITVKKGTRLANVELPKIPEIVTIDGSSYKLMGWFDENNTPWQDVKAEENMIMTAAWAEYVDKIELFFDTPSLGDTVPEATVPEDALYKIEYQYCEDAGYNEVEEITQPGEFQLRLVVRLKDPGNSLFATETDEWDFTSFIGKVTVNGEEPDEPDYGGDLYYGLSCSYEEDEEGPLLDIEYFFPVYEEEESVSYSVVSGAGATWTKGSDKALTFVVKRSENDAETFGRFTELKVDGVTVAEEMYTAEAGSLVLDLKTAYLETLSTGSHTLTAVFDDGTAEADFIIKEEDGGGESEESPDEEDRGSDENPETGDEGGLLISVLLMAASLIALAALIPRIFNQSGDRNFALKR